MSESVENKIIRSVKVDLAQAVPGMVLAEDLRNASGSVIMTMETVLKREHIRSFQDSGLSSIFIESYCPPKEFNPLRGKVAIIIDDSPFIRHMFAKLLYRMGVFVAEESETAEYGMRAAHKYKPDLIIMDICLPGIDGITAMKKLRTTMPGTKFLVVSTESNKMNVFDAMKSGADAFLAKPIPWETLKPKVLELIGDFADTDPSQ